MTEPDKNKSTPDPPLPAADRFTRFRTRIAEKILVFDGAMGTSLQARNLPDEIYGEYPVCFEFLNLALPDAVSKVHESFLSVGCDVIETNTFQANRFKLKEHGRDDSADDVNRAAASIAREIIQKFDSPEHPRFIAGSIGPLGCLPSMGDPVLDTLSLKEIQDVFYEQALGLIIGGGTFEKPCGADCLIIETGQDLLELRQAVFAAESLRESTGLDIPLIVSFTLDASGKMLLGSDVAAALACFIDLPIDVIGINCSTGPGEMRESVRYLGENAPMWISTIPNAGIPYEEDGELKWPLGPDEFASLMKEFAGRFRVSIVGGCCGTTPDHIRALVDAIGAWKPAPRPKDRLQIVSSPLSSVNLDEFTRPIVVGERLNAQGSKKAKAMVLAEDIDGLFSLAQKQVDKGASILDISLATSEHDNEADLMERVVTRLTAGIPAALMIDTTDPDVVEKALSRIPGRAIVNSINFEGGEDRARKTLELVKRHGSLVICMTIDEQGMALEPKEKRAIARRMSVLARTEYGIEPDRLLFDPLTFTLATGDDSLRRSAINSLTGLREIRDDNPESYTALGISNVSYGLPPNARKVLNSVFLYHAIRAGLDFAIVHAGQVLPYPTISSIERELAENLLFDRNANGLQELIEYFQEKKSAPAPPPHPVVNRPPDEGLRYAIIHRKKDDIELLIDRALELHSPEEILNDILLPAMQEVGEKMGTGEIILPFVLQSAEVMKAAVARLENYLPKDRESSRGKILLATVAGDVHDIGKNLVKTILQNNGYEVCDLGKQVPNSTIVARAKEFGADIVGLSALLVTTSRQMEYCVEELHRAGCESPVIIGGAAINRLFARRISWIGSDHIYSPGVYYAHDAFEGLQLVQGLLDTEKRLELVKMAEEGARTYREDRERKVAEAEKKKKERPKEKPGVVLHDHPIPTPPFWGARILEPLDPREVFKRLDTKILFKLNWGIRGRTADEYHQLVSSTFEPLLEDLQEEVRKRSWLIPSAVYGFFPANSSGEEVIIYDPFATDDPMKSDTELGRFKFPRQQNGERLCVSDYFRPLESGERDVIALQIVTMGGRVTEVVQAFTQAGEYAKGFFLHGLAMESAEAMAEYMHRRIKSEMGLSKGQGHRYSFGYPSTPDLSQQEIIFRLLDADNAIGTRLTKMWQIVPEQSTSAFIVHHPDARYFHVEGEGLAAVLQEPLE